MFQPLRNIFDNVRFHGGLRLFQTSRQRSRVFPCGGAFFLFKGVDEGRQSVQSGLFGVFELLAWQKKFKVKK